MAVGGFCLPQGLHRQLLALANVSKMTVCDAQVGEGDGHGEVVSVVDVTVDPQSSLEEFDAPLGLTKV